MLYAIDDSTTVWMMVIWSCCLTLSEMIVNIYLHNLWIYICHVQVHCTRVRRTICLCNANDIMLGMKLIWMRMRVYLVAHCSIRWHELQFNFTKHCNSCSLNAIIKYFAAAQHQLYIKSIRGNLCCVCVQFYDTNERPKTKGKCKKYKIKLKENFILLQ